MGLSKEIVVKLKSFSKVLAVAISLLFAAFALDIPIQFGLGAGDYRDWFGLFVNLVTACFCSSIWVGLVYGVCYIGKWKRFRTACCVAPMVLGIAFGAFQKLREQNPNYFLGLRGT